MKKRAAEISNQIKWRLVYYFILQVIQQGIIGGTGDIIKWRNKRTSDFEWNLMPFQVRLTNKSIHHAVDNSIPCRERMEPDISREIPWSQVNKFNKGSLIDIWCVIIFTTEEMISNRIKWKYKHNSFFKSNFIKLEITGN